MMPSLRPNGHHRQVVALIGIADEPMHGLGHPVDEQARFLLLLRKGLDGHIVDTLHAELGMVGIHCLGQSVGKEEDGRAGEDLRLLQRVFPFGPEADRDVSVAGQFADGVYTNEQRSVMTGIAVPQMPSGEVEHADEERHEHMVLVHVGDGLVHVGYNSVGHRLMGRHSTEGRTRNRHEASRLYSLPRRGQRKDLSNTAY